MAGEIKHLVSRLLGITARPAAPDRLGEAKDRSASYTETLEARPWKSCPCAICKEIGVEVIIFRGADRNRRRGFHNLSVFAERLSRDLSAPPTHTNGANGV